MSKGRSFSKMTITSTDSGIDAIQVNCSDINFENLKKDPYVAAVIEAIKDSANNILQDYEYESLPEDFQNLLNLSPENLAGSGVRIGFEKGGHFSSDIQACSKKKLMGELSELTNLKLAGESGIAAHSKPTLKITIPQKAYAYLSDKAIKARARTAYAVPIVIPAALSVAAVSGLLAWASTQGAASMQAGLSGLFSSSVGAVSGGAITLSVVAGLALVVALAAAIYPRCTQAKQASLADHSVAQSHAGQQSTQTLAGDPLEQKQ